ncbi:MAG: undecaprenyl/decaprenyl-phosphate alpha-N-acetylglucosaminyl 1-phosphate transferase [Bacteroidetes bacterium]|nr:undecaprenyl/decaprenyl-phosphate alpha-N-acetylglucosaminyl 1-phosphate transferase [Bacteroidota bacterium]
MILSLLFLLTTAFSYVLNSVLINFAGRLGQLSQGQTTQVRWASASKPLVGGISFFIVFLVAAVVYSLIPYVEGVQSSTDYIPFLLSITLGFVVGLADDAYTTRPILKFIGQLLCGVILLAFDVSIRFFGIPVLDGLLTLLWVIGLMNSINMLDNMDGITGSISLIITAFTVAVIYLVGQQNTVYFYMLLAIAGALTGFLILNWNPSKLYMGDTGSQFLGMLLAFLGIKYFWNMPGISGELVLERQLLAPLLVFLMPIIDTTFVSVARISRGQSPFVGGRDHTTHHLSYLGMPDKFVPLVTGAVSLTGGILMLTTLYIDKWSLSYTVMYAGFVVAMFAIFLVLYRIGARLRRFKDVEKAREKLRAELLALQPATTAQTLQPVAQRL